MKYDIFDLIQVAGCAVAGSFWNPGASIACALASIISIVLFTRWIVPQA